MLALYPLGVVMLNWLPDRKLTDNRRVESCAFNFLIPMPIPDAG